MIQRHCQSCLKKHIRIAFNNSDSVLPIHRRLVRQMCLEGHTIEVTFGVGPETVWSKFRENGLLAKRRRSEKNLYQNSTGIKKEHRLFEWTLRRILGLVGVERFSRIVIGIGNRMNLDSQRHLVRK